MPKVAIPNTSIEFFFTDSGPPEPEDYTTYIIVHGHTYHGGVFQRLHPLAADRSVRIICLNRREYPGSTPHTAEELKVYASGSEEERTTLLRAEGVNLALCVDEIIQQFKLSSVVLVAWSLGNTFVVAVMASIKSLPAQSQVRLRTSVKTIILWDPPAEALGIPKPPSSYVPLYDLDLAPEARGPAFGIWVQSYFTHPDLPSRDPNLLHQRIHDSPSLSTKTRRMTFADLSPAELREITDFTVGDKCDTVLTRAEFRPIVAALVREAMFDPAVRAAWGDVGVAYIVGEANPWNVHFAAWNMEERVDAGGGKTPINFCFVEGANHFGMWDDPSKALDALISCTE
ncbi:Alpha/Beta hydrolase protein [Mycena filopes]|nr:Alpha/Beta hydrolase protein [Mycena filopes]